MTWDPEKYREKREKVLGFKKRGVSFSTLAVVVSCVIMLGFAWISVPGVVSFLKTRHLDDAIYKLENDAIWPVPILSEISHLSGVKRVETDTHGTRLVVTFDRRQTDVQAFTALFLQNSLEASLLNQVGHRQRHTTIEAEKEQEGETL